MVKLLIALALIAVIRSLYSADVFESMFKKLGDYTDDDNINKTYYLSRHIKGTFATALLFCKNFEMNLTTLPTYSEYVNFKNNIVRNNAEDVQMELFFVGGVKIGSKNWYWLSNGTDLDYKLDWGPGEPDNPVKEQCLSFYGNNGKINWNDMTCEEYQIRFLCEKYW